MTARSKNVMLARVKIYLTTLGCKLNESEIQTWARQFARAGHEIVTDARAADVCILNTCTITHVAESKSRKIARHLARANPRARLVLTGCHATLAPDQLRALPNVARVVPNTDKARLVALVEEAERELENASLQHADASMHPSTFAQSPFLRTRAFVKVQDGCDMSCAYCVIPQARGKSCSRPLAEIVAEVCALVDAGYQEIVLTGVQISAYRDLRVAPAVTLCEVVRALIAETPAPRLRLSSLAPWDVDDALLDLFREPRLCRHLHLSLQSGADDGLRRMRRPYTTEQFARVLERARAKIPAVGITTDVIVGFPGESDAEFAQSLEFVERMQFARVHIFPYSRRAGTAAAQMPAQVSDQVKDARVKRMQAVAQASARAFAQQFVGHTLSVLWETCEPQADGIRYTPQASSSASRAACHSSPVWSGYTDNYIRVIAPSDADWRNRIARARVVAVVEGGAVATFENL